MARSVAALKGLRSYHRRYMHLKARSTRSICKFVSITVEGVTLQVYTRAGWKPVEFRYASGLAADIAVLTDALDAWDTLVAEALVEAKKKGRKPMPKNRRCNLCGVDPGETPRGAIEEAMGPLHRRLDAIFTLLFLVLVKEVQVANEIDALVDAVAEDKTVDESAVTLINKLVVLLQGAVSSGDLAKVADLTAQIKANTAALAAAVTANTPAEPPPPPPV